MSELFYNIKNLTVFEIELDLSKLSDKDDFLFKNLQNINLSNFSVVKSNSVRFFIDEISKLLPLLSLSYSANKPENYNINFALYRDKLKIEINIVDVTEMSKRYDINEFDKMDESILKNIDFDFGYLLGLILGAKINEIDKIKIKGRISCKCDATIYEKYFNNLSSLTRNVFNKKNYNVNGISFNYKQIISDIEYILDSRISKDEKHEVFWTNFEFEMKPPIKILDIINNLFSEMNSIKQIIEVM